MLWQNVYLGSEIIHLPRFIHLSTECFLEYPLVHIWQDLKTFLTQIVFGQ